MTRMLRLCTLIGAAPDLDLSVDLTPVDFVASAIAALAMADDASGDTVHWVAPKRTHLRVLTAWLNDYGIPCEVVPTQEWTTRIGGFAFRSPDDPASGLAPLLLRQTRPGGPSFLDLAAARPEFDTSNASHRLSLLDIRCRQVERETFLAYLRHLAFNRFLPVPAYVDRGSPVH